MRATAPIRANTACRIPRCTSTASSRGWTSTSGCCSSPRTSPLPLLERVKFCAIYTTNLDEYYMVRVAGLHDQIDAGVENPGQDGRTPSETIARNPRARARAGRAADRLLRRRAASGSGRTRDQCGRRRASSTRSSAPSSQRTSDERSSLRSPRWRWLPGGRFPTSRTCRSAWPCWCATRTRDQTVFARVKVPTEILPRFVALKQPAGSGTLLCRSRT